MSSPVVNKLSLLTATTAEATPTIPMTEMSGNTGIVFSTVLLNSIRNTIPKTIGTKTTWTIDMNISQNETASHSLANKYVKAGVMIGAKRVVTAVIVTESAVFPFAMNVMT